MRIIAVFALFLPSHASRFSARPNLRRRRHARRRYGWRVRRCRRRRERGLLESGGYRHRCDVRSAGVQRARLGRLRRRCPSRPGRQLLRTRTSPVYLQFPAPLTDKTGDRERCSFALSRPRTSASLSCKPLYQVWLSGQRRGWSRRHRHRRRRSESQTTVRSRRWGYGVGLGPAVRPHGRNLREPEFESGRRDGAHEAAVQSGCGARAPGSADRRARSVFAGIRRRSDDNAQTSGEIGARRRSAASTGWRRGLLASERAYGGAHWTISNKAFSGGLTVRLPRSIFVEGQVTKDDEGNENEWQVGVRVTF